VLSAEKQLHIGAEHGLQVAALHATWLIRSANVFYGSAHFLVTAAVLIWLYRRQPDRYRRWRTVLAIGTGLALIGFIVFPVLPPRMLPPTYGFQDTLHSLGGLWSFNSGVVEHISDPFCICAGPRGARPCSYRGCATAGRRHSPSPTRSSPPWSWS
jgi:hypothetical protein